MKQLSSDTPVLKSLLLPVFHRQLTCLLILLIGINLFGLATEAKIILALNWKAEPQFGGFYQAQLSGEFKKMGLDVEIVEGGSGTPTVQLLANKKVDYALVSAEEIILSQDKNKETPVVGIFATYQTNPQGIMTHAEKNYKSLQEVMESPGTLSIQSGLSYALFLKKKFPKSRTSIVPYAGGIGPFIVDKNFSQQCFITSEPLAAEKARIKTKTFLISEIGFNPYTTVLATQAARLTGTQRDEAAKVVQAVRKGWESYLKDPTSTNLAIGKLNKSMDAETLKQSSQAQRDLIKMPASETLGLGSMTLSRWDQLLVQMKELNLIKTALKADQLFMNF